MSSCSVEETPAASYVILGNTGPALGLSSSPPSLRHHVRLLRWPMMRLTAKSSYLERRITRRRGSQFWVIRGGSNLDHGRNFSPRFLLHHVALLQWLSM